MTSERIPSRPKPSSFRPVYIEQQESISNKNVELIEADAIQSRWWQTRYIKLLMIVSSMLGFVLSSACLFATILIDPRLTANFEGGVGEFFLNMYENYGTTGVISFWGSCLLYFFVTAYRNAVRL